MEIMAPSSSSTMYRTRRLSDSNIPLLPSSVQDILRGRKKSKSMSSTLSSISTDMEENHMITTATNINNDDIPISTHR
jgi:hypothetical protein